MTRASSRQKWLFVVATFLTAFCSGQTFSVSPTSLHYYGGGGNYQSISITVSASATWTVSAPPAWITLSPSSGTGSGSISLVVAANTPSASRSATLNVSSGSTSIPVTISEDALASGPPSVGLVNTPSGGSFPLHSTQQLLKFRFDSPNGPDYLAWTAIVINDYLNWDDGCVAAFLPVYDAFYLLNGETWTPYTLGSSGQAVSTHCTIDLGSSGPVGNGAGTGYELDLNVTLRPSAVGQQFIWSDSIDVANGTTGWTNLANWTAYDWITNPVAPTVTVPSLPAIATQTVHATVTDGNGYVHIDAITGQVVRPGTSGSGCYFSIDPRTKTLTLIAVPSGSTIGSGTLGSSGVLAASGLCSLDLSSSHLHANPDWTQPDPDPNAAVYPNWYVDLAWTAPAALSWPLGITVVAYDIETSLNNYAVATWGGPTISQSPASLSFNATVGGANPVPQTIAVTNPGAGSLAWTAAASTGAGNWLSVSPASGTNAGTLTVTINTGGLAAGSYTGAITISSSAAVNSPQTVPVSLTMSNPVPTVTSVSRVRSRPVRLPSL